jgi:hypothetical protein
MATVEIISDNIDMLDSAGQTQTATPSTMQPSSVDPTTLETHTLQTSTPSDSEIPLSAMPLDLDTIDEDETIDDLDVIEVRADGPIQLPRENGNNGGFDQATIHRKKRKTGKKALGFAFALDQPATSNARTQKSRNGNSHKTPNSQTAAPTAIAPELSQLSTHSRAAVAHITPLPGPEKEAELGRLNQKRARAKVINCRGYHCSHTISIDPSTFRSWTRTAAQVRIMTQTHRRTLRLQGAS